MIPDEVCDGAVREVSLGRSHGCLTYRGEERAKAWLAVASCRSESGRTFSQRLALPVTCSQRGQGSGPASGAPCGSRGPGGGAQLANGGAPEPPGGPPSPTEVSQAQT